MHNIDGLERKKLRILPTEKDNAERFTSATYENKTKNVFLHS